jgi:hypothetical protein
MNHSTVYPYRHFLLRLSEASASTRKTMLRNLLSGQVKAISAVAKRLNNGTINPMRRDVPTLERKRLLLRSLASSEVSTERKKSMLIRYHSIITVLLRPAYLIETILDEVRIVRET